MSRNKEKAQAGLNRYHDIKSKEAGVLESNPSLRPKYVQNVKSLPQAEKWRSTVLSEISVKLTRISDQATSDFQLRELNDSLNKLFKEKRAWEYHIKALGGNDYITYNKDFSNAGVYGEYVDDSGNKVKGYRYFGRAKDLPDIKPLLESKSKENGDALKGRIPKKQVKDLPYSYYGFYEDKKSNLLRDQEIESINKIIQELGESKIDVIDYPDDPVDEQYEFEQKRSKEILKQMSGDPKVTPKIELTDFEVEIPDENVINKWLVDRKKRELMKKLGL